MIWQAALLFSGMLLFFFGLKLSAFFSGTETGFYRVSTLQLTLQKQRGEKTGSRLFYFISHPERFVATTLVGNNIANYTTTLAIGLLVASVWAESSGAPEVIATLLLTPVVFIFGELIPKSLYYRAPMSLLRSGATFFVVCHILFLPLSYPLIVLSRLVSKIGQSDKRPIQVVFGRNRLYGVLEAGQEEGILMELQRSLAENLMQCSNIPIRESADLLPLRGVSELSTLDEVRSVARRTNSAFVLVHPHDKPNEWTSFVRVCDLMKPGQSVRFAQRRLPIFDANTPRLEVLTSLMEQSMPLAIVQQDKKTIGIVKRQTLVSRSFRVMRPAESDIIKA